MQGWRGHGQTDQYPRIDILVKSKNFKDRKSKERIKEGRKEGRKTERKKEKKGRREGKEKRR